ncbi:MAG: SRPBCC family protein [bacterium]
MTSSETLGVEVGAPPDQVYAYITDPRNLPAWAPGLCRSARAEGDHWVIETPAGNAELRFAPSNDLGVADHHVTFAGGHEVYVPLRVIRSDLGSEVLFTLRREPGMTDDAFAADRCAVVADLEALKRILERASPEGPG